MLLDDTIALAPVRPVTWDPALEREFDARVADSSDLAFRVALGVLRHREDAEDVAQEAFLRVRRAFASLRDRDRFRAWLVRTAFRLALDCRRGHGRRLRREEAVGLQLAPSPSLEDELARQELQEKVGRAVDALPEKLRLVTILSAVEGHGTREIAGLLGVPEGTVKSRLFLARKALAESLRCLVSGIGTR